jgi:hypothetical protein
MEYTYYWRVKTRYPERKGQFCRVISRGKMNSCLVEFADGFKTITSRNYVRKHKIHVVRHDELREEIENELAQDIEWLKGIETWNN